MSEAVETTETTTEAPAPTMDLLAAAKEVFGEDAPAPAADDKPADEARATETEPAPPPDPKAESIARRLSVAKRAEMRAAQERAELKAARETIEREKADLEAKVARYKLLEEDPVKAFEVLGLEPKTFLEKLAGEHKPENVHAKEIAALKAELEAIKAETTKERETLKQRELRQQSEAAWSEASKDFVQHIEATAEKYPHLVAEFTEGEAIAAAERALLEVVGTDDKGQPVTRAEAYRLQFGDYPDNDVIAEYLDAQAKARAEARQNSKWRSKVSASPASEAVSHGDPNLKVPPVKGSSPRTLTSRAASEKATSISKQWSQEAADEESLRILEAAMRKSG